MAALLFAARWLVACLLGATIMWALVMFFLRRRLGPLSARRGPIFAALFLVAFAAANLSIEGHAFAMKYPLLAAPAQALFLILFYLYPDPGYAGRGVRWLAIIYSFAQVSANIPQKQQATDPHAALILGTPGVVGTLIALGDMVALAPIVIGVVPQIYARSRRLAESGRQLPVKRHLRIVAILSAAFATFALLVSAQFLIAPATDPAPALQTLRLGFFLLTTLAPVGAGFLLMSGRRYDREALLRRALIAVTLVVCLLLVYAAGILALNLVFPTYYGSRAAYLPFLLPVTALLAAIYLLLRMRVEVQIGRRFFRETTTSARRLSQRQTRCGLRIFTPTSSARSSWRRSRRRYSLRRSRSGRGQRRAGPAYDRSASPMLTFPLVLTPTRRSYAGAAAPQALALHHRWTRHSP